MKSEKLFTVVIPAFNCEYTIYETIMSVRNQTEKRLNILVIDDGSTDRTEIVVGNAFGDDTRCFYIRQNNKGPSVARNKGITLSQTPYVAFLDGDDRWHQDRLSLALEHFSLFTDMDVSFCGCLFYDSTMKHMEAKSTVPGVLNLIDILSENQTCTSSALIIKKDCLQKVDGFNVFLKYAEDQDLLARIICNNGIVRGLNKHLVDYRTSKAGLSSNLKEMEDGWENMILRINSTYPDKIIGIEKSVKALYMRYLARRALRLGLSPNISWMYMSKSLKSSITALIRYQPMRSLKTLVGTLLSFVPFVKNSNLLK